MADTCEWKKGKVINSEGDHRLKFYPCEDASIFLGPHDEYYRDTMSVNDGIKLKNNYCSFCGANIRKPEPEKAYLFINNEKFPIDFNDTAEKVEKNIAEIITRETSILARVEITEPEPNEPEEKPITKKVNGVEVARYKGMDYIRLGNFSGYAPFLLDVNGKDQINACWKPMTEIQKAIHGVAEAK